MNDPISRAAAIKALCDNCNNVQAVCAHYPCKQYIAVEKLPSAQPERKTGRWVEIALSNHTYKCSVCGWLLVNITDGKNNVAKNYPYCHCGAYMGGNEE